MRIAPRQREKADVKRVVALRNVLVVLGIASLGASTTSAAWAASTALAFPPLPPAPSPLSSSGAAPRAVPAVVGDAGAQAVGSTVTATDTIGPTEPRLMRVARVASEAFSRQRGYLSGELASSTRKRAGAQFVAQATALGDAEDLLTRGDAPGAQKKLDGLGSVSSPRIVAELRAVRYLLEARTRVALHDPAGALVVLDAADGVLGADEHEQERAFLGFVAAVDADLPSDALERYRKARPLFEREFLPETVERAEVRLARWMNDTDPVRARQILRRVGRNYPLVRAAREAYDTYSELTCRAETPHAELEFFGGEDDAREFSRTILRRLGPVESVRELAFTLARVPDFAVLSKKNPDTLPTEEKAELLAQAEFLLSVRESARAHEITSYLSRARVFGTGFERDKLLFLQARGLNSVDKPKDAARTYAQLYQTFPRSQYARVARQRYVLSLHYAQKFKDVARESRRLAGAGKSSDASWRVAWAEYLSKDSAAFAKETDLASSSRRLPSDTRVRLDYWRARDLERQGKADAARVLFDGLSKGANDTHYALFARWRLVGQNFGGSGQTGAGVRLAARAAGAEGGAQGFTNAAHSIVRVGNEDAYARLRVMVDVGLREFARVGVTAQLRKERDASNVRELARIAFHAQDFKSASLFPRRLISDLRAIPSQGDALASSLNENDELWQLSFPLAYRDVVHAVAKELDMDPFLVLGIMRAESNYDMQALSGVGARGLMQIMPYTGHRIARLLEVENFNTADLNKPYVNIAFGAWYLKRLTTYYRGNLVLAIAAYNAGPEAVDRWLKQTSQFSLDEFVENIPYEQTRTYVGKVLLNMDMYHRLYDAGGKGLVLREASKLPTPVDGMEMF